MKIIDVNLNLRSCEHVTIVEKQHIMESLKENYLRNKMYLLAML
jgi:hypothetical protein